MSSEMQQKIGSLLTKKTYCIEKLDDKKAYFQLHKFVFADKNFSFNNQ